MDLRTCNPLRYDHAVVLGNSDGIPVAKGRDKSFPNELMRLTDIKFQACLHAVVPIFYVATPSERKLLYNSDSVELQQVPCSLLKTRINFRTIAKITNTRHLVYL